MISDPPVKRLPLSMTSLILTIPFSVKQDRVYALKMIKHIEKDIKLYTEEKHRDLANF